MTHIVIAGAPDLFGRVTTAAVERQYGGVIAICPSVEIAQQIADALTVAMPVIEPPPEPEPEPVPDPELNLCPRGGDHVRDDAAEWHEVRCKKCGQDMAPF